MRQKYQEVLNVEVDGFQGRVQARKTQGLRGSELVNAVVQRYSEEGSIKRNWGKGDSVWQSSKVIDEANKENRKEFWAFVGRTSKGNRKGIVSLKSTSGSCATCKKGKSEVLQEHYERLGTASVDDQFDDSWKQYVENKVAEYN